MSDTIFKKNYLLLLIQRTSYTLIYNQMNIKTKPRLKNFKRGLVLKIKERMTSPFYLFNHLSTQSTAVNLYFTLSKSMGCPLAK